MTSAPDNIWAMHGCDDRKWYAGCCSNEPFLIEGEVKYIRSDIVDNIIAEVCCLREALNRIADCDSYDAGIVLAEIAMQSLKGPYK